MAKGLFRKSITESRRQKHTLGDGSRQSCFSVINVADGANCWEEKAREHIYARHTVNRPNISKQRTVHMGLGARKG